MNVLKSATSGISGAVSSVKGAVAGAAGSAGVGGGGGNTATTASTGNFGTESRAEILPSSNQADVSFMMPDYDFSANVLRPSQVGVRSGGSIEDVIDAAKGIVYYVDTIGFGEKSGPFSPDKPQAPLGINFFMNSGLQCDNGADMSIYFNGIPKGDALGPYVQQSMREMGLPQLRGLAPGMIEDAKDALNPMPIVQATFGSAYPKCEQASLPVGDVTGRIRQADDEEPWIKGNVEIRDGKPYQTRWVQARTKKGNPIYLNREQWEKVPKTHNRDGTPKSTEGFESGQKASLSLAILFFLGATIVANLR